MSKSYSNHPIKEALCGFKFRLGSDWNDQTPDLIYARVQDRFPVREREKPPFIKFRRPDNSALLQVSPNSLTVNQLKPYPTWRQFRQMILEAYAIYREIVHPAEIERLGLRYLNQINFAEDQSGIDCLLRGCPKYYHKLFSTVELPFEAGDENLFTILSHVPQYANGEQNFVLDLDYGARMYTASVTEIEQKLNRAHARIVQVFESYLTDDTRRMFGWKKEMAAYDETYDQEGPDAVRDFRAEYGPPQTRVIPIPPFFSGATVRVHSEGLVSHYKLQADQLEEKMSEPKSLEEEERLQQLEMEMGVERDIVFKEPERPSRIITATVYNMGRAPVPDFLFDPPDE